MSTATRVARLEKARAAVQERIATGLSPTLKFARIAGLMAAGHPRIVELMALAADKGRAVNEHDREPDFDVGAALRRLAEEREAAQAEEDRRDLERQAVLDHRPAGLE